MLSLAYYFNWFRINHSITVRLGALGLLGVWVWSCSIKVMWRDDGSYKKLLLSTSCISFPKGSFHHVSAGQRLLQQLLHYRKVPTNIWTCTKQALLNQKWKLHSVDDSALPHFQRCFPFLCQTSVPATHITHFSTGQHHKGTNSTCRAFHFSADRAVSWHLHPAPARSGSGILAGFMHCQLSSGSSDTWRESLLHRTNHT